MKRTDSSSTEMINTSAAPEGWLGTYFARVSRQEKKWSRRLSSGSSSRLNRTGALVIRIREVNRAVKMHIRKGRSLMTGAMPTAISVSEELIFSALEDKEMFQYSKISLLEYSRQEVHY